MILDAHTHMTSEGWPGHSNGVESLAEAVAYLKAAGTDAAIFNMWQGVFAETEEDLNQGNAIALELAETYAGFLYPGACIHPAFPEASKRWLRTFREQGYRWVGELVQYRKQYNYTDPEFLELCEVCATEGHILQLHGDANVYELAKQFPNMQVVCAHILPDECKRLAELSNTWVDISGSVGGIFVGGIEAAYAAMGADRLLYGTDFTGYEPRCFQIRLEMAVPDAAEREKILWKNLVRLLEMVGARPIVPIA